MKKIIFNLVYILLIFIITIEVLINNKIVIESVKISFSIWQNNIFPSLFPFFIIGNILINLGLPNILGEIFKNITYKLFKINKNGAFIIILSMLSGFPSSAKYIKEMHINGDINEKEATKLLTFTHFSNPLFILGTLATFYLKNKTLGIIILVSHYLGNFFIGIIFRNYYVSKDSFISFSKEKKYFSKIFLNAIYSCIKTLLLILGTLTCFLILSTVISYRLNLNSYHDVFLKGFLEVTSGLKALSNLNVPLIYKTVIATLFLSFGGFCVNMQVISQISDTDISYKPYFIARFMHLIISSFIAFILYLFVF